MSYRVLSVPARKDLLLAGTDYPSVKTGRPSAAGRVLAVPRDDLTVDS